MEVVDVEAVLVPVKLEPFTPKRVAATAEIPTHGVALLCVMHLTRWVAVEPAIKQNRTSVARMDEAR